MSADQVSHRKIFHVMPENGHWQILEEASSRAFGRFDGKQEAIAAASQSAGDGDPVRVVVHKSDGSIESRQDFPQFAEDGVTRDDIEDDYLETLAEFEEGGADQKDAWEEDED